MGASLFAPAALFVTLHQTVKVCLVLGVLVAYLSTTGWLQYRKYVWWGAGLGLCCACAAGVTGVVLIEVHGKRVLSGSRAPIFQGSVLLVTAAVTSAVVAWMMLKEKTFRACAERHLDVIIDGSASARWGIFTMAFIEVGREVLATFVFLGGVVQAHKVLSDAPEYDTSNNDSWKSVPIPAALGVCIAILISCVILKGVVSMNVRHLVIFTSLLLTSFAAGLVSQGTAAYLQIPIATALAAQPGSLGMFPFAAGHMGSNIGPLTPVKRRWFATPMWSTRECCDKRHNQFFSTLRSLFGYNDTPSFLEFAAYFAYWFIFIAVLLFINWDDVTAARSLTATVARRLSAMSFVFTLVAFLFAVSNVTWNGVLVTTLGLVLSVCAVLSVTNVVTERVPVMRQLRRGLALETGIGFAFLTLLIICLHIAQMACSPVEGACSLPQFLYWGIVLNKDYATAARTPFSYRYIAVLSISLVLSVFFFGALSLVLILFGRNVSAEDGEYINSSTLQIKHTDIDLEALKELDSSSLLQHVNMPRACLATEQPSLSTETV